MIAKSIVGSVFLLACACHAFADEPPYYNVEEAEAFFDSKEHIAIVVRINGGLSYREYERLRNEYALEVPGSTAQEKRDIWETEINVYPDSDYVVLKNFKGELEPIITMPNDYINAFRLEYGEPHLVLLEASPTNSYTLETGQAFHFEYFPDDVLAQSNADELLEWLLSHLPIQVARPTLIEAGE